MSNIVELHQCPREKPEIAELQDIEDGFLTGRCADCCVIILLYQDYRDSKWSAGRGVHIYGPIWGDAVSVILSKYVTLAGKQHCVPIVSHNTDRLIMLARTDHHKEYMKLFMQQIKQLGKQRFQGKIYTFPYPCAIVKRNGEIEQVGITMSKHIAKNGYLVRNRTYFE